MNASPGYTRADLAEITGWNRARLRNRMAVAHLDCKTARTARTWRRLGPTDTLHLVLLDAVVVRSGMAPRAAARCVAGVLEELPPAAEDSFGALFRRVEGIKIAVCAGDGKRIATLDLDKAVRRLIGTTMLLAAHGRVALDKVA